MAEEKEPLDNSRLGKSKRKLVRLQNELNEQIEKFAPLLNSNVSNLFNILL